MEMYGGYASKKGKKMSITLQAFRVTPMLAGCIRAENQQQYMKVCHYFHSSPQLENFP